VAVDLWLLVVLETPLQLLLHKEQMVEPVQLLRPQQGAVAVAVQLLLAQQVMQAGMAVMELHLAFRVLP
jgi:hypothetical protein